MNFIEAFKMAINAIWSHKLRSFLTLVGIIAGVASIIAVMTGISVIQSTIEHELSVLGTRTFQVQKTPSGGFGNDINWRKMRRRPPITVEQANALREKVKSVDLVGAELWDYPPHRMKYKNESTNSRVMICGGTPEYSENNTHHVRLGRNISNEDVKIGRKVAVIGPALADQLFPFIDPVDKIVKLDGRKFRIVGVFEEKQSFMGGNFDNYCLIPVTTYKRAYGLRDARGNINSVNVTVRAVSAEMLPSAIEEVRAVLRHERKVKPKEEDNFFIFTNDSQIRSFNQATSGIKIGAFVIGIVALLVAGIGIMNIMLVSVTERTKEIGIRKSLGAKRKLILGQFLLEATTLSNIGGVLGVAVGFGLGNIVAALTGFQISIPINWAIIGLVFCTTVGLTFGFWPAVIASRLDPIEALRYE
jgi:putative ABC transport system permease protein